MPNGRLIAASDHDNRNICGPGALAKAGDKLETIHLGHVVIDDEQIDVQVRRFGQGAHRICKGQSLRANLANEFAHQNEVGTAVIDNEHIHGNQT